MIPNIEPLNEDQRAAVQDLVYAYKVFSVAMKEHNTGAILNYAPWLLEAQERTGVVMIPPEEVEGTVKAARYSIREEAQISMRAAQHGEPS